MTGTVESLQLHTGFLDGRGIQRHAMRQDGLVRQSIDSCATGWEFEDRNSQRRHGCARMCVYFLWAASRHVTPSGPITAEWRMPGGTSSRCPGSNCISSLPVSTRKEMDPRTQ